MGVARLAAPSRTRRSHAHAAYPAPAVRSLMEGIVNTVAMACSGLYAEGRAAATGAKPCQ